MKILHTSDWHLGKKLYKKDRLEEQKLFLHWLLKTIKEKNIQILIIAGDIFDTAIPSTESLSTFFQFIKDCENLSEAKGGPLKKVLAIGGNHDNPLLVETPRPFLMKNFFHIVGKLASSEDIESTVFKVFDKDKTVSFTLLPFFRPRELVGLEEENEKNNETNILLEQLKAWLRLTSHDADTKILVGHHLFGSFMASGSEQGVALSGLDSLPLSMFKEYDLLCLGHIHKKQVIKKEAPLAVYCGSPFPLRFSESNDKSCEIYELCENGILNEELKIPLFRGLFRISCKQEEIVTKLSELLAKHPPFADTPHFLELEVKIDKPIPNLVDDIREEIKDLPVILLNFFTVIEKEEAKEKNITYQQISNTSTLELFNLFLETKGIAKEQSEILGHTLKECLDDIKGNRTEMNS